MKSVVGLRTPQCACCHWWVAGCAGIIQCAVPPSKKAKISMRAATVCLRRCRTVCAGVIQCAVPGTQEYLV